MSKTAYHLQLKGFAGAPDFDRKAVDNTLEKKRGKQVNILIDSTGGNLANYFDYKRFADDLFSDDYEMGSNGHVSRRYRPPVASLLISFSEGKGLFICLKTFCDFIGYYFVQRKLIITFA